MEITACRNQITEGEEDFGIDPDSSACCGFAVI